MKLPHKFGKYVLLKKIAQGGMAEIYKAKYYGERGFAKDVAVKRILPVWSERKEFENMLVDEAKALVHLQHQNIVQIYELGRDDEFFYISMEYVDGIDLRCLYKKVQKESTTVPEKFACFIISEVLKGLESARRQKSDDGTSLEIVHRDISPQNILLSYNGEVKLADFGIAKGLHRDHETTTAQLKGKYAYMSPEQAEGMNIDHRSDLFSSGIVLYEVLVGSRLFESTSDFEIIRNVRESKLPEGWEAKVTLNMRKIIRKALAKGVNERYQTAAEFLKDIDNYVSLKRLHTNGFELSDYLSHMFAGEKDEVEEQADPPVKKGTKVLSRLSKIDSRKKMTVVWRYASALMVFALPLIVSAGKPDTGGDSLLRKNIQITTNDMGKKLDTDPEMLPRGPEIPIINSGIINIDSEPSRATGILTYGDVEKNFTTPFVLADLDVGDGLEIGMKLSKDGYSPVSDTLKLSKGAKVVTKKYKLVSVAPAELSVHARPWGYISVAGVLNKKESPVNGLKVKPGRHQVSVYYSPTNTWARRSLDMDAGSHHRCLADFTKGGSLSCN